MPAASWPLRPPEETRQYKQGLLPAPKLLCHPCQQSVEAKGHRFLGEMLAALPLQRVNGLLVFRFRMKCTVGAKGPLSLALAERIMDALENYAFASSWALLQAVPLYSPRVAGGHLGGNWLGILGPS